MPIYEYKCQDCGCEFEVTQAMSAAPLTECRQCSGRIQRLISFTAFSLKGSGWYSDGYANGSSKNGNGSKPETTDDKPKNGGEGSVAKEEKTSTAGPVSTTVGKSD